MTHGIRLVFTLALSILSAQALADAVYLKNGSKIVGDVIRIAQGELTLESNFDDPLVIAMDRMKGITTEQPLNVAVTDGRRFEGMLKYSEGTQTISDSLVGTHTIAISDIVALWEPGGIPPKIKALQQALEEKDPQWSQTVELGINGQTGNTERLDINSLLNIERVTPSQRLLLFFRNRFATESGQTTSNEYAAGARAEFDFTQRIFAYGGVQFESDEFQDLDLRVNVSAGGGYFFLRREDHEFKGRAGLGLQHESFDNGPANTEFVPELGYNYLNKLIDWLKFEHSLTYYPVVDDPMSDFRLEAETSARMPLAQQGWSLRAGFRNSYDNQPRPTIEKLDTVYFLNLSIDF